ncbi:hypothetical protein CDL12_29049 [Handroanthus impetiginosus]|uniref:Uncharacterized protein n=1 Tax=Handroanthus impetiginosus TaxID=429701 RepID=A0A2G9FZJ5_9LAMI|nr:hypothetical protein CDL12_29049 [Handroanthus impetiginosus]
MKNLESKMGAKHREALEKPPFSIYKEIPSLPMSLFRLPAIIRRFQERNISFAFARGVEVSFTPSEFSIILGLPTKEQPVDVNLKMKSKTMERLFSGKLQNLNRKSIVNKLDELANKDSAKDIDDFFRAKDQEIKELKKRVAELEETANKDLCVLAPVKANAATTKEQRDHGAACEKQGDNDGEEKEKKDEEDKEKDDEDGKEKEKAEKDEQKEEKTKEGQDDKKGEKEDGDDEEGNEKEGEEEEKRKDDDDDEERDHDADNEYNDMNKENQTKHLSCHHEVEMNKKLEGISQKLDFGQDVDFDERDYEVVRTLSSIIDDELIEKWKVEDFDSPLSTTSAKRAKQSNEENDHDEERKTIPEQEKAGPPKKMIRPKVECEGI